MWIVFSNAGGQSILSVNLSLYTCLYEIVIVFIRGLFSFGAKEKEIFSGCFFDLTV